MELVLPELIDLNAYINSMNHNRFVGAKIKKDMTELVYWKCKEQKLPKLDKISKITFIWKHKNKKKDFDNVEFAQKWVRDGLVMAGIVPNDGWTYMPPRTLHKHRIDKENPGVLVLIK